MLCHLSAMLHRPCTLPCQLYAPTPVRTAAFHVVICPVVFPVNTALMSVNGNVCVYGNTAVLVALCIVYYVFTLPQSHTPIRVCICCIVIYSLEYVNLSKPSCLIEHEVTCEQGSHFIIFFLGVGLLHCFFNLSQLVTLSSIYMLCARQFLVRLWCNLSVGFPLIVSNA